MTLSEFINKYRDLINKRDFVNPIFDSVRGSEVWGKFISLTLKNGIDPLEKATFVPSKMFYSCRSLTSISLPDNITSIGYEAFSGCNELTSISIPNSVIKIRDSAFGGCISLESIIIGNGVISIGNNAFFSCTSLTSVTIGSSVESIGHNAFWNCGSLCDLIYRGTKQQFKEIRKHADWRPLQSIEVKCTDGSLIYK